MGTNKVRVVLVDDHRVVRQGLRSYLESFPDLTIVGMASNGEEVIQNINSWRPDVVVMDLLMPGGIDGIEATRRVRSLAPQAQVVVLTSYQDDARVVAALRAGAIGYVRKDADPEILLAAVRAAAHGQAVLDPTINDTLLADLQPGNHAPQVLTRREQDVLRQLALGCTNREIAQVLTVGEETVKSHVGNILTKLGLEHRNQAIIYALKHGYISLDELKP